MTLTRSTRATFSFEVCITRLDIMVYLHVQCFCWLGHHLGIARTVSRHSLVPMICILLSVKQMTLTYQHFFIWYELTLEQSISNIAISLKFVQLKLLVGKIPLIFFSNPVFCINLIVICKARWARRKKTGKKSPVHVVMVSLLVDQLSGLFFTFFGRQKKNLFSLREFLFSSPVHVVLVSLLVDQLSGLFFIFFGQPKKIVQSQGIFG